MFWDSLDFANVRRVLDFSYWLSFVFWVENCSSFVFRKKNVLLFSMKTQNCSRSQLRRPSALNTQSHVYRRDSVFHFSWVLLIPWKRSLFDSGTSRPTCCLDYWCQTFWADKFGSLRWFSTFYWTNTTTTTFLESADWSEFGNWSDWKKSKRLAGKSIGRFPIRTWIEWVWRSWISMFFGRLE